MSRVAKLVAAALSLASLEPVAADSSVPDTAAWADEDACDASDVDCALSLRQLRAAASEANVEQHSAEALVAPDEDQELLAASLPEAEEFFKADESSSEVSLSDTLHKKKTIRTGYHLTSPAVCQLIMAGGFKPGSKGWCGGAIYFAASYQSVWTKAIGVDSHTGCLLQVKVDLGRVKRMSPTCDMGMTGEKLAEEKKDSIVFNPGDGIEFVIFDPARVLSVKQIWHDPKLDANSNKMAPVRVG